MKIIDLLNKIANGEEVPKKIKYKNMVYEYYERLNDFYNYKCVEDNSYLEEKYFISNILTDEVEIIEESDVFDLNNAKECGRVLGKFVKEFLDGYFEEAIGRGE